MDTLKLGLLFPSFIWRINLSVQVQVANVKLLLRRLLLGRSDLKVVNNCAPINELHDAIKCTSYGLAITGFKYFNERYVTCAALSFFGVVLQSPLVRVCTSSQSYSISTGLQGAHQWRHCDESNVRQRLRRLKGAPTQPSIRRPLPQSTAPPRSWSVIRT